MTSPSPPAAPPTAPPTRSRRLVWVGFLAALWTLLGLLSAAQAAAWRAREGRPVEWPVLLADRLADWYSCALFTPAYFWLARRFPITRRTWARGVAAHAGATAVFVVLKYVLYVGAGAALGLGVGRGRVVATVLDVLYENFVYENMAFWAVAGVVHAVEFYRHAQEREAHAARLRAELARAQLDALAGQLRPHFLFNTLNSVSSLMHRDVDAADAVLARLGDLLRRTLRSGERHEVPLADELEVLGDYVAIVAARFRDRLTVDVRADAGTEQALVPHFLLQPLVENALEHGIARRAGAGRVEVRAERAGEWLRLSVADDGPGIARGGAALPEGIGLANTRRRLAVLYGDRQRLALADRPGEGLVVTVDVPFRLTPNEKAAGTAPAAAQLAGLAAGPTADPSAGRGPTGLGVLR